MSPREHVAADWRSTPIAIFAVVMQILLGGVFVASQFNAAWNRARVDQTQSFADILAASGAAAVDYDVAPLSARKRWRLRASSASTSCSAMW